MRKESYIEILEHKAISSRLQFIGNNFGFMDGNDNIHYGAGRNLKISYRTN